MGCGFSSPKAKSFIGDGATFLDNIEEMFDVIITDASDPIVSGGTESSPKEG